MGLKKKSGALNYGTYSGGHNQSGTSQFFHGHGDSSGEKDIDRERYFRIVDDFVYNNYSNENKLPLIVYTVEENQAVFRDVSTNEFLAETGINGSAANLNKNEIQERATQTIDEIIAHQRNELLNELKETTPENRIENIPDDLTSASLQGRIETLYLEKYFEMPGTINDEGMYEEDNGNDDFVQQLVQNVLRSGGMVYILDETETPEDTPIAARLRY